MKNELTFGITGSLGLGTYLFVKLPRPGDSEGTDLFGHPVKLKTKNLFF